MQPLTEAELKSFAPGALRQYVEALVNGWTELQKAEINTPMRLVEFLTQAAHETGGFTIIQEKTSWSAKRMCEIWPSRFKTAMDPRILACAGDERKLANLAYSGRSDIGNNGGDDGWVYRGCGFFQDTGRARFRELGTALGLDLENNPELLTNCDVSLKAALWLWRTKKLNRLADRGYTRAIGNAINRGNAYASKEPIGHASRMEWKRRAMAFFGDEAKPISGLALGAHGSEVEVLQARLKELGYGTGASDKVFGPATARAVVAFKHDARLKGSEVEPDEVVGERTWQALNAATPIVYPEREGATAKDLAAMGSTEVAAGQRSMATGKVLLAASVAKGAQDAGAFEAAQSTIGTLPAWHGLLAPVIAAVQWGFANFFWVLTAVLAVFVWTGGHKTVVARVRAHVKGWNLFR